MNENHREIDRIHHHFEKRADRFDALYEYGSGPLVHLFNRLFRKGLYERLRLTLEWMGDLGGKSLLDLGCGSGRLSVTAAIRGASGVTGVDLSDRMLELARRRAAAEKVDEVCRFVQMDFYGFEAVQKYDFTVALGVFDYVDDPARLIGKMASLTREGLIASFPGRSLLRGNFRKIRYSLRNCPLYLYNESSILAAYRKAGFPNPTIARYPSGGFLVLARPGTGK
jgi:cyclopropane fatty-acyl-phospholipid synthase-like methyltransferase